MVLLDDFFQFDRILSASKTFLSNVYYLLVTLFSTGLLFTFIEITFLLNWFSAANLIHCAMALHKLSIPNLVLLNLLYGLAKGALACVTSQNWFVVSSPNLNDWRFVYECTLAGALGRADSHKWGWRGIQLLVITGRVVHRDNKTWKWLRCCQDSVLFLLVWLIITVYIFDRATLRPLLVVFIYSSYKAIATWGDFILMLT